MSVKNSFFILNLLEDFISGRRMATDKSKWVSLLVIGFVLTSLFNKIAAAETESNIAEPINPEHSPETNKDELSSDRHVSCRELRPCEQCNKLESKSYGEACSKTGYRIVKRCMDGDSLQDFYESCPNGLKTFWIFEFVMLFAGIVCGNLTMFRRRHLDRLAKERIMEQIENSA